jgi:hypothetical protein
MIQRNLHQELKELGLDDIQANKVIEWANNLPIHIHSGIRNTKVSIEEGIVEVRHTITLIDNFDY